MFFNFFFRLNFCHLSTKHGNQSTQCDDEKHRLRQRLNNICAAARQGTARARPLHRNLAEVEIAQAAALQHPSGRGTLCVLRLRFLGERLKEA